MENQNPNANNPNGANDNKQKGSPGSQVCVLFASSLIFATCFGVFTNDPEKYGGSKCEFTTFMTWCKAAFIHNLVILGCSVCVLPALLQALSSAVKQGKSIKGIFLLFNLVNLGLGVASFTIFIGLCVTYGDNDPCGQLRELALAYIILSGIGLGMAAIAICCLCACSCLVGGAMLGAMANRNNLPKADTDADVVAGTGADGPNNV